MSQSLCKNYLLVSKSHEEFGQSPTSSGKSKELKFNELLLSKKYIPSAFSWALYTESLFNFSCHFWSHMSFFTTQLLCIFLAWRLHTFYKSSPSKWKFSDFPLLGLKFTKFLMLFFKQNVSFSSKFGSFFSVMRDNFSVLF